MVKDIVKVDWYVWMNRTPTSLASDSPTSKPGY